MYVHNYTAILLLWIYTLGTAKSVRIKEVLLQHSSVYVAETMHSVLIKGGVLISRVVLYTSLCCWDNAYSPGVLISGVLLYIGIMHNIVS